MVACERGRRSVGLFLAPLVTIVFFAPPLDLPAAQHTLAAVPLGVIVLWVTEPVPIPVGGVLGVAAVVMLGVAPASSRSSAPRCCSCCRRAGESGSSR